jgi:hypothetical protein
MGKRRLAGRNLVLNDWLPGWRAMTNETPEFIPTRSSLLSRLKDRDDAESWREFFQT